MTSLLSRVKALITHLDTKATAKNLSVPLSFILPISILYLLEPDSFQLTWKGRAPYLIFLWLFFLEFFMTWEKRPKKKSSSLRFIKTLAVAATIVAPTAYIIAVFSFGLNNGVIEIGKLLGAGRYGTGFLESHWPLSFEYLLFTVLFTASILLMYGINGLKRFSVCLFLLGGTGLFYMVDTFYPFGFLKLLQSFVPFTASWAATVLNWLGYETMVFPSHFSTFISGQQVTCDMPVLLFFKNGKPIKNFRPAIFWPCAGIHSLLIYTLVILLFIKNTPFSIQGKLIRASIPRRLKFTAESSRISSLLEHRTIHTTIMVTETFYVNALRMIPIYIIVAVGAVGTFVVNILRIVSICIIGIEKGSEAAQLFHSYYGELYFIAWIITYLMILLLLSRRIRARIPIQDQAGRNRREAD